MIKVKCAVIKYKMRSDKICFDKLQWAEILNDNTHSEIKWLNIYCKGVVKYFQGHSSTQLNFERKCAVTKIS